MPPDMFVFNIVVHGHVNYSFLSSDTHYCALKVYSFNYQYWHCAAAAVRNVLYICL